MNHSKPLLIGIVTGIGVLAISLAIILPLLINVPDYRVEIDAVKVSDLVEISNVRITNTGKLPLTDITVNMGQGDIQSFAKLEPGKTVWVSPRAQNLVSVTVTSAEGVLQVQDFREPASMVAFGPG